jgi:hypothetical protein
MVSIALWQKEYVREEVHENRVECLFSLLKPFLRAFRGISKAQIPPDLVVKSQAIDIAEVI